MTLDLSWQVKTLTEADVAMISSSVLGIAGALEELTNGIALDGPGVKSRAERDIAWKANPVNTEGSTHVESAQKSMRTMCLSATDHMRTFVQGVRSRRTTVSNWTLARGAVESFGSAHFLAQTGSPEELLGRYVAILLEETKYNKGQTYAYRYGDPINVDDHRQGAKKMLAERGIHLPNGASTTSMARTVIDDSAPGSDGRTRYSQLSAVAHGQAPGVHMFMPTETGTIALPRALAIDAAHLQVACAQLVGDELTQCFLPGRSTTERWEQGRGRATAVVLEHARTTWEPQRP